MKTIATLLCVVLLSHSINCWFGSDSETTTVAPTTTTAANEQASTTVAADATASTETPATGEQAEVPLGEEGENFEQTEGGLGEENPLDGLDFYMFSVKDMSGNDVSLEAYRGYVTLVVNVASKCGYTDATYKDLVALQTKFEPTGMFTVLGFPCNQFWDQEPDTHEEILKFVTDKYQVNFPLFSKTDVSGDNASDAWHYLAQATGYAPQWNFWKYLIDQNGHVIDVWSHETAASELEGWIEDAISKAIAQAEGTYVGEGGNDFDAGDETHEHHDHEHGGEL